MSKPADLNVHEPEVVKEAAALLFWRLLGLPLLPTPDPEHRNTIRLSLDMDDPMMQGKSESNAGHAVAMIAGLAQQWLIDEHGITLFMMPGIPGKKI